MIRDIDPISSTALETRQPSGPSRRGRRESAARRLAVLPAAAEWDELWREEDNPEGIGDGDVASLESKRESGITADNRDDYLLQLYLRDVRREPRLSAAEEKRCAWRAWSGDEQARQKLVTGNLRLAIFIAFRYSGMGLPVLDLVNEGNLGLMRAAELFNPSRGARFSNYAAIWIRQRIRRALASQKGVVRVPESRQAKSRSIERALSEREPLTMDQTESRRSWDGQPDAECISLNEPLADNCEFTLEDTLAGSQSPAPDEAAVRQSDRQFIDGLLADLSPRERQILRLRFGLEDGDQHTLEETGRETGLLRQRVHQLEAGSLEVLRKRACLARLTAA